MKIEYSPAAQRVINMAIDGLGGQPIKLSMQSVIDLFRRRGFTVIVDVEGVYIHSLPLVFELSPGAEVVLMPNFLVGMSPRGIDRVERTYRVEGLVDGLTNSGTFLVYLVELGVNLLAAAKLSENLVVSPKGKSGVIYVITAKEAAQSSAT